jgi:hypothetical protein
MLERAGPIVVGIANIFAAASRLELDLDSEQPVIKRPLGLGYDFRVPFRPLTRAAAGPDPLLQ